MRIPIVLPVILLALAFPHVVSADARERSRLDFGWRFHLGDAPDAGTQLDYPEVKNLKNASADEHAQEAALAKLRADPVATNVGSGVSFVQAGFDDSGWQAVDVPHDWVVALPFNEHADKQHGYKDYGGDLGSTIGWYRREFDLPVEDRGKTLWVEFDGVSRNCLVWLNGHCLGRNVSGYSSFYYDISKVANYGGKNELVVRVDAGRYEGWFYEGAGIYRHVWLTKMNPVHVGHWGAWVTSRVVGQDATVTAHAIIRNDSGEAESCFVMAKLLDQNDKSVGEARSDGIQIPAGQEQEVAQSIVVKNVRLWSLDSPNLYTLETWVVPDTGNTGPLIAKDIVDTPFGVRTIHFDPDHGFFLNGKHMPIQGTCNHQDFAGVGIAMPDALQDFRVKTLKEFGINAWRTSHGDPAPELLDACDRLGMLVMDEHRRLGDTPEILDQVRRLVMRDRNHPSVILWSICNEEHLQPTDLGRQFATAMVSTIHGLDTDRPVTAALVRKHGVGISLAVDVEGVNYYSTGTGPAGIDAFHAKFPQRAMFGSEEASTISTRGIYAEDAKRAFAASYDEKGVESAEAWMQFYAARPWLAGAFVWTGFDYRGEPFPFGWPGVSSQFGILDLCGFPKDLAYLYKAAWTDQPMVHLFPHWNWPGKEGQPIKVWCYANVPSVELFLNGVSLGRKDVASLSHAEWMVNYQPGTLEAVGYRGNAAAARDTVQTTGAAARLVVTADRAQLHADGQDAAMVDVAVVDAQGRTVPTADNLVQFQVTGDAKIIGVGNGDPSSHESDHAPQRRAFNGLCMAIVQAGQKGGAIQFTAVSPGLQSATVDLTAKP